MNKSLAVKKYINFVFFSFFICIPVYSSNLTPNQIRTAINQFGGPEQFLKRFASNENEKRSGQIIGGNLKVISVIAQKKTIVYHVRLLNYEASDIGSIADFRAVIASSLSRSHCSAQISSFLINEHNAEYKYMNYSRSGVYLFSFSFNRATCSSSYRW